MMRKIKFRAFWKDTKELIPDFSEEYIIDACNDDIFLVSQFTGLKDKDGKEIYEGDIVECISRVDGKKRIEQIYFHLGAFVHGNPPTFLFLTDDNQRCKVIGNIHQNPEVLK